MKHGTAVRPTMYMASMDIKTAFDEAKPKRAAKNLNVNSSDLNVVVDMQCVWKCSSLKKPAMHFVATMEGVAKDFTVNENALNQLRTRRLIANHLNGLEMTWR